MCMYFLFQDTNIIFSVLSHLSLDFYFQLLFYESVNGVCIQCELDLQ